MITLFLAGQARVGKTTAANHISAYAKKNDFKPVILPFAQAIKEEAALAGLTKENNPTEYREFCQKIGREKRIDNPDYWVNQFYDKWAVLNKKDAESAQSIDKIWKETVVIVDDCRYLNELNLGRRIGAKTIFISRGSRTLEDQKGSWRNHESEDMANQFELGNKDYQDIFEFIVKNDKTLDKFKEKIDDRIPLFLDLAPQSFCECDCIGCRKMRKDEPVDLTDFFKDLFGDEN